jgi:hypothetical protein
MLTPLLPSDNISLEFTKDNLKCLTPYFDLDFVNADLKEKIQFYYNLRSLAKQSSRANSLAHFYNVLHQGNTLIESFDPTVETYSDFLG